MGKGRLEAFSDGFLAIIITIMVLELKVPKDKISLPDIYHELGSVFLSYVLSFIYIAIYWNNHHHMMHAVHRVTGSVLWSNVHLLFWLSLVPFTTAWMGENHFSQWPVMLYGFNLMMAGIAYYFLAHRLVKIHGKDSAFSKALGNDWKGKASVGIYALAILLCFIHPMIAFSLYVVVAAIWFIPDKRFEKELKE
jgi:uncharacterized membrane protein